MKRIATLVAVLALGWAAGALAQSAGAVVQGYPTRPIKVVIPWPPGQATDLSARMVAGKIAESVGQPVVPDNRAGAGGMIGSEAVARSAPDGYTLLAGSSGPLSINPILQKASYDPEKDFAPVSLIATVPYVLVTAASFPASNAKELVALLRANPGKYTFASSGTGATAHLVGELFNTMAQVQATHVPYKGSGPALADLMGGQVTYMFDTLAAVVGHVKSGRLKAYGLSGARGNAALPDVPTIADAADLPGFDMAAWIGYLAPAGTPPEVLARLAEETRKALQAPEVRERYLALGMDPVSSTPQELAALMRREHVRYTDIIRKAKIKLE